MRDSFKPFNKAAIYAAGLGGTTDGLNRMGAAFLDPFTIRCTSGRIRGFSSLTITRWSLLFLFSIKQVLDKQEELVSGSWIQPLKVIVLLHSRLVLTLAQIASQEQFVES
jgi:hypothetical protein